MGLEHFSPPELQKKKLQIRKKVTPLQCKCYSYVYKKTLKFLMKLKGVIRKMIAECVVPLTYPYTAREYEPGKYFQ